MGRGKRKPGISSCVLKWREGDRVDAGPCKGGAVVFKGNRGEGKGGWLKRVLGYWGVFLQGTAVVGGRGGPLKLESKGEERVEGRSGRVNQGLGRGKTSFSFLARITRRQGKDRVLS